MGVFTDADRSFDAGKEKLDETIREFDNVLDIRTHGSDQYNKEFMERLLDINHQLKKIALTLR